MCGNRISVFPVIVFLLFTLSSCAQMAHDFSGVQNKAPANIAVTQIENPKLRSSYIEGKVRIEYIPAEQISSEVEQTIKNEMLSEKDAVAKRKSVPKGGRIIIHIFRKTIGEASTNLFTYILKVDGKDVVRKAGTSGVQSVPQTPTSSGIDGNYWTNLDIVEIPVTLKKGDSVQLFVADKLSNERDEFKLAIN